MKIIYKQKNGRSIPLPFFMMPLSKCLSKLPGIVLLTALLGFSIIEAYGQNCPSAGAFNTMTFSPSDATLNANHSIVNISMTPQPLPAGYEYRFSLDGGPFSSASNLGMVQVGGHCVTAAIFTTTAVGCGGNVYSAGTQIPNTLTTACVYFGTNGPPAVPDITGKGTCATTVTPVPSPQLSCFNYEYRLDGGNWSATLPIAVTPGCHTLETRVVCASPFTFGVPTPSPASPTTYFSIFRDLSGIHSDSISVNKTCTSGATANGTVTSIGGLPPAPNGISYVYQFDGVGPFSATLPTNLAPGCHTVVISQLSDCTGTTADVQAPSSCNKTVSFVIYPEAPAIASATTTCVSSIALPSIPAITGFKVEYELDSSGVWFTTTPNITTPGCHTIRARYALVSACGTTPAGTPGPLACGQSNKGHIVLFPAVPVLTAPTKTCGTAFQIPAVQAVAGFTVQYSIESGPWTDADSVKVPLAAECYSIRARYRLTASCGAVAAGTPAPTACATSNEVMVVVFPDISTANIETITKNNACGPANITAINWQGGAPSAPLGFELRYDIDGGTAFTNKTGLFTNIAPGCHTIAAKWVRSVACGSNNPLGTPAQSGCEETHTFMVWPDLSGSVPKVVLKNNCGAKNVRIDTIVFSPQLPAIPSGMELVYFGTRNDTAFGPVTLTQLRAMDFAPKAGKGCHSLFVNTRAITSCKDSDDATAAADGANANQVAPVTCQTLTQNFITFPAAPDKILANSICQGDSLVASVPAVPMAGYAWRYRLVNLTTGSAAPGNWQVKPVWHNAGPAGCYRIEVVPVRITDCGQLIVPDCNSPVDTTDDAIFPNQIQLPLDLQQNCNPDPVPGICAATQEVFILPKPISVITPNNLIICVKESGSIDLQFVQQNVPTCLLQAGAQVRYIITSSDQTVAVNAPAPGLLELPMNQPELDYIGENGNSFPNVVTIGITPLIRLKNPDSTYTTCFGTPVNFSITVRPNITPIGQWSVFPNTSIQCENSDGWVISTSANTNPSCQYELYYGLSTSPIGGPIGNALIQTISGDGGPLAFQKVYIPGIYQIWQRCNGCAEVAFSPGLEIVGAPVLSDVQFKACPDQPGGSTATFTNISYPVPPPTVPVSIIKILGYYKTYTGAANGIQSELVSATGNFNYTSSDGELFVRIGQNVDGLPGDDCYHVGVIELRVVNRPIITLAAVPNPACANEPVTITASVNAGSNSTYTYKWSANNSALPSISVTSGISGPVSYSLTVSDPNINVNGSNGPVCTSSESITVNYTAPTVKCPSNITTSTDPSSCSAYQNLAVADINAKCADFYQTRYYATGATSINTASNPGTMASILAVPFKKGVTTINAVAVLNGSGTPVSPAASCSFTVTVNDTEKPDAKCKDITLSFLSDTLTVTFAQVNGGSSDNCTVDTLLKKGIRKKGMGTGFPVNPQGNPQGSVKYTCPDLGVQLVEVWVQDQAGNTDWCEAAVTLLDNNGACSNDKASVSGILATDQDKGLKAAQVTLSATHAVLPPVNLSKTTGDDGVYLFDDAVPLSGNYSITPAKDDNPLNGVSTFDLILISRHILGLQLLDSPFKIIAADANKNGTVTSFDIVEFRKLILGIYSDLPANESWRFVDASFVFPNPQNPFQTPFPEKLAFTNTQTDSKDNNFISIKVGDVNGSVIPNDLVVNDDRSVGMLLFDVQNRWVKADEVFEVKLSPAETVEGYQFTLNIADLEIIDIIGLEPQYYAVIGEAAVFSVDGVPAQTPVALRFRAKISGQLSDLMQVSGQIARAEAYNEKNERLDVAFRYNGHTVSRVGFEVYQNVPNPFVGKTQIGFHLPEVGDVILLVTNESGGVVYRHQGKYEAGYNSIVLDLPQVLGNGVYFYSVQFGNQIATRKMLYTPK